MPHNNHLQLVPNQGWDERILICRNDPLVDIFIVVTARYVVLVDTLINPTTARAMFDYAQPHLTQSRQLLVVNTHADYDHCWGNQIFAGPQALYPAPILAHQRCAQRFHEAEAQEVLQEMQAQEPAIFGEVVLTPPTLTFADRLQIDGGDLTLELFPTPGHTPDHIALYIPEIKTLLAADAAEVPFPAARSVEGLPLMRQSLATLAALNATTVLYCHAAETLGAQVLHANIVYFDKLEAACRTALARGVSAIPAEDVDVAGLVGCTYADATPANPHWQGVHEYYPTRGHAQQMRMMLAWLQSQT